MEQTSIYNLNQWAGEDRIQREDFNADNAKIEAALASVGNCKVMTGTYVGTNTVGADSPNSLPFEFEPKLLIIYGNGYYAFLLTDSGYGFSRHVGAGSWDAQLTLTKDGNRVSWYCSYAFYNDSSMTPSAQTQMNSTTTYHYIAIG